jgi:hypothetical protein
MTNAQSIPDHEMTFVPPDLVSVQVGRLSVSLYPKVETGMPVFERAHAFQVNKSALKPLPIVTRLILDVLGAQLNFPHITLQLGSSLGDSDCPTIRCVVDTAATLTTEVEGNGGLPPLTSPTPSSSSTPIVL